MRLTFSLIFLGLVIAALYVRFAPLEASNWHVPVTQTADADYKGGAVRVVDASSDALTTADSYMRGLPRTRAIAGSLDSGRITYVTRSKVLGFPDYTTIEVADGQLRAYARLRYGKSDFGVNRERLEGLIAALQ